MKHSVEWLVEMVATGIYETSGEDGYLDSQRAEERAREAVTALLRRGEPDAWVSPGVAKEWRDGASQGAWIYRNGGRHHVPVYFGSQGVNHV